jgi:predicted DCC family thiol-disulfide oxidoreductase YuxK
MPFLVIYDGNCNLCVTLVQLLESLDGGDRFRYVPMQDEEILAKYDVTPQGCELGMILLDPADPEQRWQGSDAAEEIGRRLPLGEVFVSAYRSLPGLKSAGDRVYEQVRDNRYDWFGKRDATYRSRHGDRRID